MVFKQVVLVLVIAVVMISGGSEKEEKAMVSPQTQKTEPTKVEKVTETVKQVQQVAAQTAQEAIDYSQKLATLTEKKDYLIDQANNLYNSDKFQEVVDIAKYVLSDVDVESVDAQSLLEKAQQKLAAVVENKVNETKSKLGEF